MATQVKLKGRKLVYTKSDNRFTISIPPSVGHALLEDGIKTVDVIIIVPDKEVPSNQRDTEDTS